MPLVPVLVEDALAFNDRDVEVEERLAVVCVLEDEDSWVDVHTELVLVDRALVFVDVGVGAVPKFQSPYSAPASRSAYCWKSPLLMST